MTNVLVALAKAIGVIPALAALVSRVLAQHGLRRVVDLGSGGGGVMPDVLAELRKSPDHRDVRLTMTDLHPNAQAVARFEADGDDRTEYLLDSVDATDLGTAPLGLKTMVNSFHHMRPEQARKILASAQSTGQPLLVYEMGENKIPFAVWCLALPITLPLVAISSLVLTLMVRPLTVRQLVLTYLVPLVPIFYAWDGQASMPRLYTFDDLDELLAGIEATDAYTWEKGHAESPTGRKVGTYLLGVPTTSS